MKIDIKEIEHAARVSMLVIDDIEKEIMLEYLNEILGGLNEWRELDLETVPAAAHILPLRNVFRDDEESPSMKRQDILQNAPSQENGYFTVPRMIE